MYYFIVRVLSGGVIALTCQTFLELGMAALGILGLTLSLVFEIKEKYELKPKQTSSE